jgi:hypothetical protein
MNLSPFTLGIDYRELSPREGGFRWRWELTQDMAIPLPFICPPFSCRDEDGWEWMSVEAAFSMSENSTGGTERRQRSGAGFSTVGLARQTL